MTPVEEWRRLRSARPRAADLRPARTLAAAPRVVPLRPVPCDHLQDTTSRYDPVGKVLTFLLVCRACGTEKVVDTQPYEPRFTQLASPRAGEDRSAAERSQIAAPKTGAQTATQLQRLATLAFRRRRTFVAVWLLLIVAAVGCYVGLGSTINSDFTIPGSSSQDARDELQKALPPAADERADRVRVTGRDQGQRREIPLGR